MRGQFWKSYTFKFWFLGYLCILLLPQLAGTLYYSGVQRSLTAKAGEMSRMSIEQAASVIDEKLKMINNVADSIYVSSEIKRIKFLSLPYNASTYYELHRRAAYLGNFSFQSELFRYLYIYYSDMNCLMDSQRLFTKNNQIASILRNNVHMSEDDFVTFTSQKHYNRFYLLKDGTLLFLRTLSTRDAGKKPIITLVAVINTDSLREVLAQTGANVSGRAWLTDVEGAVFSPDGEASPLAYAELMQAEQENRQAVPDAVTVSIPSSQSQLLYVLSIPNDVFRLEAMQSRRWFWAVSIIALALGGLFSYYLTVRNYRPVHALKQKISGEGKVKDDFSLINERLSELLDEENNMHSEIKRLDGIANKRAFHLLLSSGYDALDERQRDSFHFNGDVFVVAWLCREDGAFAVQSKSGGTADPESILEVFLQHLCDGRCVFAVQQESAGYVAEFCFLKDTDPMDAQLAVCDICVKLVDQLKERFPQPLTHAYIGDGQIGIEKIHLSYQNALRAKEYADFLPEGKQGVMPFDPLMYSADISWRDYDIMDAERNFIGLMLEGSYAKAEQVLHEIMSYYSNTDNMNLYVMRCRMFGVMNMMLNVLHEIEPDMTTDAYSDFSPVETLLNARSPSELERIVFDIIGRLVGAQEIKNADAKPRIKQIQRYIAANYFNVNLSVQMVADAYDISLPYLSRIFKKQYGFGLLDYINRYRVEKAKELLRSGGEESVASIASRVGFNSSQTLIRVFKRYENMTPGQYKAALSQEDEISSQKMTPSGK